MPKSANPLTDCKARLAGDRIAIEVPFSFGTVGFFQSFGWPRACRGGWTVAATPYSAVRLRKAGVELDDELIRLASEWFDGSEFDVAQQPAIYKHEPWEHQRLAYWFAIGRCATLLPIKMGGGKTKIANDLLGNWGSQRVLILCPTAVLPVWPKEFAKHFPGDYRTAILEGSPAKKLQLARQAYDTTPRGTCLALVVSYESAWRKPLADFFLSKYWDVVVLDESHKIKDPAGKASKFCAQLGLRATRRLALTGTPMPHSPLDLFAQYRFLEPAIFGTSVTGFKARYAELSKFIPNKVDRWINQEELGELMSLCAVHIDVELDLPPVQHIDVPVTLSAKCRKVYDQLESELVADIVDSEDTFGTVKIDNPLVKVLRLQQVACGFVSAEADELGLERVQLELDTSKADTLSELLEDLEPREPVVVFCRFRHDLDQVAAIAAKLGRRYGELSGRRNDLTREATLPSDVDLLGVQIRSGGAGIDLTRASTAVFFSIGCISQGDFGQACARLDRPGQTKPVKFYHLLGIQTVDERAYEAIANGREIVEFVLAALRGRVLKAAV
jgi:SNF2 family DNA or RNA helicase